MSAARAIKLSRDDLALMEEIDLNADDTDEVRFDEDDASSESDWLAPTTAESERIALLPTSPSRRPRRTASPSNALNDLPVSRLTTYTYGFGEISFYTANVILGFFLGTFLLEVAELSPNAVGIILLVGSVWDAISEGVVGELSDRTRSALGRRRPWIILGSAPFAICYAAMWQKPHILDEGHVAWKITYYSVIYMLLQTFGTVVAVPYVSLTADITPRYDERTKLTTLRFFYAIVAAVLLAFMHSTLIEAFKDDAKPDDVDYRLGYSISALIIASVALCSLLIVGIVVKERYYNKRTTTHSDQFAGFAGFLRGLKILFSNRPFIMLVIMHLLGNTAINLVQSNLFLYVKYVLKGEKTFNWILLTLQVSSAVSLFGWHLVSKRIGKRNAYFLGTAITVAVVASLFPLPSGLSPVLYVLALLAGPGIGASLLLPWAMLPDVAELDELMTHQRREGIFASIFGFVAKLGVAFAVSGSSFLLGAVGYVPPDEQTSADKQPHRVLLALKLMVGPIPAALLLLSLVPMAFYSITRSRHEEIRKALQRRQYEEARAEVARRQQKQAAAAAASSSSATPFVSLPFANGGSHAP